MDDLGKLDGGESEITIQKIKVLEVLQVLSFDSKQFAAICRLEPKDPSTRPEDIIKSNRLKIVILDEEKEGTYICFIKEKFQM